MDHRARARAQLIAIDPAAPAEGLAPPPQPADPAPAAPAPKGPPVARKHTSITVPLPVYRKLREIAYVDETTINDVILRAVDAMLRGRGATERTYPDED